jgi:Flp pilus assembly protein TadD
MPEVPEPMPTPFLSSEEYDERAHTLYNEGQYEAALEVLREGLALYPGSVELHVGVGYARLAREEYAWARQSFEMAIVLDGNHEDALAGLGETLLKLGQKGLALTTFRRILELGYEDDLDLVLQVGRALFRDELMEEAREFFDTAVRASPELAEAQSCLGYALHRLGKDDAAIAHLERALELDDEHTEARIYLANILYDRGEYDHALRHLERTSPEDHWDALGIWRYIELKKSLQRVADHDPEFVDWRTREGELVGESDPIDDMLAEIEARAAERAHTRDRAQLELFTNLLADLAERRHGEEISEHSVLTSDGAEFRGSWDRIVRAMKEANAMMTGRSVQEFMATEARRGYSLTGVKIPTHDAESFLRGSADAGLLRIVL